MRLLLLAVTMLAMGCSTAGPFVTNISSVGPDQLLVEKCYVELNAFVGYVTNKDCSSVTIKTQ